MTFAPASVAIVAGSDQVAPSSVERSDITSARPCGLAGARTKTSTSVPSGTAATMLPTGVPATVAIARGLDQVRPASVVVDRRTDPAGLRCPLDSVSPAPFWSQTSQARPARFGSAVTASLSLNARDVADWATGTGVDHVMPPSVERLTLTQLTFGGVVASAAR